MKRNRFVILIIFSWIACGSLFSSEGEKSALLNREDLPNIDFSGVFFDFQGVDFSGFTEKVFLEEQSLKFVELLSSDSLSINIIVGFELAGYNLYSIKDVPFFPRDMKLPDYRIASVIKSVKVSAANRTDSPDNQGNRIIRMEMDVEWILYDVKNDLELLSYSEVVSREVPMIKNFFAISYSKNYFLEIFNNCFFTSFQMFNLKYNINLLFSSPLKSDYQLFKHLFSSNILYQKGLWQLFSENRKSAYIDLMLKSSLYKDLLFDEYIFVNQLREEFVSRNKEKQIDIISKASSAIHTVYVDDKASTGIFLNSKNIAIVAGLQRGSTYLLEIGKGIMVEGKLHFYDEKFNIAFVEFPFFSKKSMDVGLLDSDNNSDIFILTNYLDLYRWEGAVEVLPLTLKDPYGQEYSNEQAFAMGFEDKREIDSKLVGLPVLDYFGNMVGIVCFGDDNLPVIVNSYYLYTIFEEK
ncbi:MAG: hypothetical protein JXR63_10935 [Spirochaetales bacterium]|nr:hypothetical protein [Spirochaetales bacterium]